jgi:hypothetical protein
MNFSSIHKPRFGSAWINVVMLSLFLCSSLCSQDLQTSNDVSKSFRLRKPDNGRIQKSNAKFTPPPWPPMDVDAAELVVDSDRTCELPKVLRAASQHAAEFSANLDRFTATEIIQSANAQKYGAWTHLEARMFDYMALVTHPRSGISYIDESRVEKGLSSPPAIRTEGLAVTALIFHPQNIGGFSTVCEGLGRWHGKPSWMVHFAQKPDAPADFQVLHVADKRYPVKLKGRAWLAAGTYEIEHIDVDLLEPIPEILLSTEHLSIDYGSVAFANGNSHLWLPQQADFYLDIGNRHFYSHHQLSHFLLFSVGVQQDTKQPKLPAE